MGIGESKDNGLACRGYLRSSAKKAEYSGKWYWIGVALVIVLVGLITSWNVYVSYNNLINSQYNILEITSKQCEARISASIRSVHLTLNAVIDDLSEHPDASVTEVTKTFNTYLKQMPEIRHLFIADSNGIIRVHTYEKAIGYNASDREYFSVHKKAPDDESFHISSPFKTITGVTATTISKARHDRQGRFVGIIAATLESGFFNESLSLEPYGPGFMALLINNSGDILNTFPVSEVIGKSLKDGPAFTSHVMAGEETTRHLNVSKLQQIKRLSVFHNSPDSRLAVIVSRDYDSLIGEWLNTVYYHISGFLILSTVTVLLAMLAARRQSSLMRIQGEITARELELTTIIESEPECVKQITEDCRLLFMNRAGLDMIEVDNLEQVRGESVLPIILPEYRDDFIALTKKVFAGGTGNLEFEIQGLRGCRRFLETHAVPLMDSHGKITSLLGITRDITERKKAEQEKEVAVQRVKTLEGIIPICMYCKQIRDDQNCWNQLEKYITTHSGAVFSHGICPKCLEKHLPGCEE